VHPAITVMLLVSLVKAGNASSLVLGCLVALGFVQLA
jgi:hypothetical protein